MDRLNNYPFSVVLNSSNTQKSKIDNIHNIFKKNNKEIPFIVGICGGMYSGKSSLAKYLREKSDYKVAIIEENDFFKFNKRKLSTVQVIGKNDDLPKEDKEKMIESSKPESYDLGKLKEVLTELKKKKKATLPYSSYQIGHNKDVEINSLETPVIIVVGKFIFRDKDLREFFNLKMFIELEDDYRVARILLKNREKIEKNSEAYNTFFMIYKNFMKISFEKNTLPYKQYADIKMAFDSFQVEHDKEVFENNGTVDYLLVVFSEVIRESIKEIK